jgi:RNA polymerase sigma-70 factor, ECF subfamily
VDVTTSGDRDRAWLEALFAAHHRQVLAYALRRLPPHEADDVLSEVFAAAWQHRHRVPDPPLPWLYRAASNTVLHSQRSHSRRGRLAGRWQATAELTQEDHAAATDARLDDTSRVHAALALLSARDAEVLRLSVWEDLDLQDLAFVLDCTPTAAKVRLHRARRRFSAALVPPGPPVLAARTEVIA